MGDAAARRWPNIARPAIIQLSLVLGAPVSFPIQSLVNEFVTADACIAGLSFRLLGLQANL